MSNEALNKQITDYLLQLTPKQKRAVLTVVKTFVEEQESFLKDPEFLQEMDERIEALESGKVTGRTWEEVKLGARKFKTQ